MIFGKRNTAGQGDGVLSCDGGGDSGEGHHGSVQEGILLSLSGREGKSLQDAESIVEKRKSWYTYIHRQGKRERALEIIMGHAHDDKSISSVRSFVYDMLGPAPDRGDLLYRYEHSLRAAENAAIVAEAEGLPNDDLIIASCSQAIDSANWIMSLPRGTRTAQDMINENCRKRIAFLQDILAQANKGL